MYVSQDVDIIESKMPAIRTKISQNNYVQQPEDGDLPPISDDQPDLEELDDYCNVEVEEDLEATVPKAGNIQASY